MVRDHTVRRLVPSSQTVKGKTVLNKQLYQTSPYNPP